MAEQHDLLKARRESAALLGLGDVERLSPADTLRCDLISTLRLAIDGEQATVLDGGAADLAKLITATENLIRLLPNRELPEPAPAEGGPNDPRTIMWENYKRQRDRGALHGEGYDGLVLKVKALEAEIERLKAGTTAPDEPAVLTGTNVPTNVPDGSNVVPLSRPPAARATPQPPTPAPPPPAAAPAYDYNARSDWKDWVNEDGSIRTTPLSGGKYWGPV
jgi:hypothetical protein